MSGLLVFEGVPASECTGAGSHQPRPLRFIYHHLLVQAAGGQTNTSNLVQLCDLCHYAVHDLLWVLARDNGSAAAWKRYGTAEQRSYAQQGYDLAVQAGTVSSIPNEGGIL